MGRFLSLLVAVVIGSAPVHAQVREGCDDLVTTANLARQISQADVAFSQMDDQAFRNARWAAQRGIVCLGEPIQPGQAAAYYRMEALASFIDSDHARSVTFFRSMMVVAPHYLLPDALAPEDHPLRVHFEVARGTVTLPGEPVPRAASGVIRIDGDFAIEIPRDRPYLFQHVDEYGRVQISTVVGVGVDPPRYPHARGVQTQTQARRIATPVVHKAERIAPNFPIDVRLMTAAGISAAISGVTYAMAVHHETKFWDPTTSAGELAELRDKTNNMVYVSSGAAAVALTTGVAAVVVGHF